jgi:hypothetical protein
MRNILPLVSELESFVIASVMSSSALERTSVWLWLAHPERQSTKISCLFSIALEMSNPYSPISLLASTCSTEEGTYTIALLTSVLQKARSCSQLTSTIRQVMPSFSLVSMDEVLARSLPTKREVIHEGLQPSVPVSNVSEASGGSRMSCSIAGGIRFREDILRRAEVGECRI